MRSSSRWIASLSVEVTSAEEALKSCRVRSAALPATTSAATIEPAIPAAKTVSVTSSQIRRRLAGPETAGASSAERAFAADGGTHRCRGSRSSCSASVPSAVGDILASTRAESSFSTITGAPVGESGSANPFAAAERDVTRARDPRSQGGERGSLTRAGIPPRARGARWAERRWVAACLELSPRGGGSPSAAAPCEGRGSDRRGGQAASARTARSRRGRARRRRKTATTTTKKMLMGFSSFHPRFAPRARSPLGDCADSRYVFIRPHRRKRRAGWVQRGDR